MYTTLETDTWRNEINFFKSLFTGFRWVNSSFHLFCFIMIYSILILWIDIMSSNFIWISSVYISMWLQNMWNKSDIFFFNSCTCQDAIKSQFKWKPLLILFMDYKFKCNSEPVNLLSVITSPYISFHFKCQSPRLESNYLWVLKGLTGNNAACNLVFSLYRLSLTVYSLSRYSIKAELCCFNPTFPAAALHWKHFTVKMGECRQ